MDSCACCAVGNYTSVQPSETSCNVIAALRDSALRVQWDPESTAVVIKQIRRGEAIGYYVVMMGVYLRLS